MDLSYGKEYDEFRKEVRTFLEANWPPKDESLSRDEQTHRFRRKATEAGYLYRSVPRNYGGGEQPPDEIRAQVIREEFSRAHAPGEARGIGTMMLVPTLVEKGDEWQKEKFIEPTLTGEIRWCQGYSEPGSGSDLASLQTRAELVGDEWVINGQKIWTTGAHEAEYMFCLCRTEPDASKHAGISYLLIPMKQEGISVSPLRQMTGGADFNQVFLEDARTPKDWIVGKRGEGWLVSRATLKHERNSIGAAAQSTALFQGLVGLARSTPRGEGRAIDDPSIRQALATLEGRVKAHEYSGYRQLTVNAKGENPGLIGYMNKLHSTTIGNEASKIALEILGDEGLCDSSQQAILGRVPSGGNRHWITQYMYSLGISVAGGTANIQRNVIGERGLGLPRDFYADRSSGK